MQFAELSVKEYEHFIESSHMPSHYFQMVENIKNREREGSDVVLLGVKEDGDVIAASLFSKIPTFGSYMYYSNRGPVMDFHNKALVNFYFTSLDNYLKRNQALTVKIDPYWIYQQYDKDVITKQEFGTNDFIIEQLKSLGYTHTGLYRGYRNDSQVRWMSVLYLDGETPQTLMKQFDSQRKRNVKKAIRNGVKVRFLESNEIDRFLALYNQTAERTGFYNRGDDYYKNFAQSYGDKVLMPLAYIDLEEYNQLLSEEINELESRRDQMMQSENKTEKHINKIAEQDKLIYQAQQNLLKVNELMKTDGKILDLAAGIYFVNSYEMNYYSGGSDDNYQQFMGPYAMHWHMINYCLDNGFNRYNFYGVSGVFDESGEDYGVYRFKRGFNAQIEELVGDFTKVINKPKNSLYAALTKGKRIVSKIKK